MITNEEKTELNKLCKDGFTSFHNLDRKTLYETELELETTLSNLIQKYDKRLKKSQGKSKKKKSIEDIIDLLLKGKHSFHDFVSQIYPLNSSLTEREGDTSNINNYLKIVSKQLSQSYKPDEQGHQFILLSKVLLLLGGLSSDDKSIQSKMFSLSRRI